MKNAVCDAAVLAMFVSLLLLPVGSVFGSTDDPNMAARNPYPADGEINVATDPNQTLSWSLGDVDTEFYTWVSYYVHVDVNEANVAHANPWLGEGESTEATSYAITGLEPETEYFWRIDTKLASTLPPYMTYIITGEVWSFTTMPERAWDPDPADGAEYVEADPNVTLSWKLGDLDSILFLLEHVRYRVYYGTDFAEVSSRDWWPDFDIYVDTSVQIGPLTPWTTYYWRIDTGLVSTRPPHVGVTLEGDVWMFTTGPAPPRVITVDDDGPADFNNIQAAIDDSNDGDTVLVANGTYTGHGNRDIDFHGKAITVKSENGPETCIIDCNGTEATPHRGAHFHSGEDANSAIIGFTITNGYADIGGGILCDDAGPSIVDCVMTLNTAYDDFGGGYGGGIYCHDSNALVIGCTLTDNEARYRMAEIPLGGHGSGIYSEGGNAVITKCILKNNGTGVGWSGVIHCHGGYPTITGCEISSNRDNWRSGIWLNYCRAVIRDCTLSGRDIDGIMCNDVSDGSISGCAIIGNSRSGINAEASNLVISDCLIADNRSAGIHCVMSQSEIRNCSIVGNGFEYPSLRGAVYCEGECTCTIIGSILWNNDPYYSRSRYPQIFCDDPVVSYSCLEGWDGSLAGVGNIGEYPMFADPGYWDDPCNTPGWSWDDIWVRGDYHLKSRAGRWDANDGGWVIDDVTSPCIDAGDPISPVGPEVFPNGGIVNMGTYGGTAEASKSYFGRPACETVMAGDVNGDCEIDFEDLRLMALHWCEQW